MNSIRSQLSHCKLAGVGVVLSIVAFATGCVSVQPLSTAARAGDTVTLAVGSPQDMTMSNTSAVFVPETGGGATPVSIRSIFKVYPDKTSDAWLNDQLLPFIHQSTGHAPWQTLMVVDLPASLPVGPGTIEITTAASFPGLQTDINDVPVELEILPGNGQPHQFPVFSSNFNPDPFPGNFSRLEPLPQVVFQLPGSPAATNFGAVEVKLNVNFTNSNGLPVDDSVIRVIPDEMASGTGTQVLWTRSGDVMTVNYINPTGEMPRAALRFSVVPTPNTVIQENPPPSLLSVRYFYPNGLETSGPVPTVTLKN